MKRETSLLPASLTQNSHGFFSKLKAGFAAIVSPVADYTAKAASFASHFVPPPRVIGCAATFITAKPAYRASDRKKDDITLYNGLTALLGLMGGLTGGYLYGEFAAFTMLTMADIIAGVLASSSEWQSPSQSHAEAIQPFGEDFGILELGLDVLTMFSLFNIKDLTTACLPLLLKMGLLINCAGNLDEKDKENEMISNQLSIQK